MEFLRQLIGGLAQAWRRLSISARVNLGLAAAATVAIIATAVFMSSRPEYVRLYDRLDPKETSRIVDVLTQEKVPYQLTDNDQTVLVPLNQRSRMKMLLSQKGLPTLQGTAPGFESFKDQDLMTNRWLQDVKYMRAVQGELQRQLNEFEFINRSFVFIREAKEELFSSQQKPSEAAVTLDVKRPLTKNEIKAVLHTVSSFGGANLSPDNITLVTTDGTALHLPPTGEFASIANSKLEYVAELEKQREDKVVKDLEQRLGVHAVVKVSATVDFDSSTETTKKSEDGAVVSSYSTTTTTPGKQAAPQGAPGTMANLPEGAAATPPPSENGEKTEETIENFEPGSTETKTTHTPGKVKQYLVSAIIEGDTKKVTDANGKETTEYVPLTEDKKKMYEDYIRAAVGEGEMPTKITVNDQPFSLAKLTDAREAFQTVESSKRWDVIQEYVWKGLEVLLILSGFWMVRRLLRNAFVTPVVEEERSALELAPPTTEELQRDEVAAEVARMSQENPEAVVALLRSWIAQDEE